MRFSVALATFAVLMLASATAPSARAADLSGAHDFDFEFGDWTVHHKIKRPTGEWIEFDGTSNSIQDRKSTRLNSSHPSISYAVFCLKKKKTNKQYKRNSYQEQERRPHMFISMQRYRCRIYF